MTAQALFGELDRRLQADEKPSEYLNDVFCQAVFDEVPFNRLKRLAQTEQSPVHHPEGNVWNHTMLVVDEAAAARTRSKHPRALMWAALLHDIGKPDTTRVKNGKITAYDHDRLGAEQAYVFLRHFTGDLVFVNAVADLVRYHMQILYVVRGLPFADMARMLRSVDVHEIALLGLCDRLGRANCDRDKEKYEVMVFLRKCKEK